MKAALLPARGVNRHRAHAKPIGLIRPQLPDNNRYSRVAPWVTAGAGALPGVVNPDCRS